MTDLASFDRRVLLATGAALFVPGVSRAQGFCDFAEFGPDPTGRRASDAAFERWISAAIARGQTARAGVGLFRLAASHSFDLVGERLAITGAGPGKTHFQRAPGTIDRNGEVLMRFKGARGASVAISGVTVDMNCDRQPRPPGGGALADNFAWQHSIAVEFLPQGVGGFTTIAVKDCEVRDPVSDGFAIRGGPSEGAGVGEAVFTRVVNRKWPIDRQRPRVRGDVTITSIVRRITVADCVLPRLHYEVEPPIPPGTSVTVVERDNRVGELLAHFSGNYATPARVTRTMTGGIVAWRLFQGNSTNRITGADIVMRRPGRLTGGAHRFERCRFVVAPGFQPGDSLSLFHSSYPVADSVDVIGGSLTVAAGARPPRVFVERNGRRAREGSVSIAGLAGDGGMKLVEASETRVSIRP